MTDRAYGMGRKAGAGRLAIALAGALLIGWRWLADGIDPAGLLYEVPVVHRLPWLETPMAYLYLHFFTLGPVLLLSFDRKVHYYRKWRFLVPAILLVGLPFIAWDVFFTARGVWGFNETYVSGLHLLRLPVEEWLFFVSVPFACVFIYECLICYFPRDPLPAAEKWLTPVLIAGAFGLAAWRWQQLYTFTTFLACGLALLYHLLYGDARVRSRFYQAFGLSLLPFLLVNGVLTGGYTEAPVVLYNPGEYIGLRLTSIPVDDMGYGFLLLLGNVSLYAFFRKK